MPVKTRSQTKKTVTTTVTKGPVKMAPMKTGKKGSMTPYLLAGLVVIGLGIGLFLFFKNRDDDKGTKAPSRSGSNTGFCAVDANCLVISEPTTGTVAPLSNIDELRNELLAIDGINAPSPANQTILGGVESSGELLFLEADTNLLNVNLVDVLVDLDIFDLSQGAVALTLLQQPLLQSRYPGLTGSGDLVQIMAVSLPEGSGARTKTPEELAATQAPDQGPPPGTFVIVPKSFFNGTCPPQTC